MVMPGTPNFRDGLFTMDGRPVTPIGQVVTLYSDDIPVKTYVYAPQEIVVDVRLNPRGRIMVNCILGWRGRAALKPRKRQRVKAFEMLERREQCD